MSVNRPLVLRPVDRACPHRRRLASILVHVRPIAAVIASLAAACADPQPEADPPPDETELAPPVSELDSAFTDSVFRIWIRGNDGSTPGDVLYVGQTSRLIGFVVAEERDPQGPRGGLAREVESARVEWRSLSPQVLAVEPVGRVRALRPGRGAVEATAIFEAASPSGGAVRDTMSIEVLEPDTRLARLRVSEVSSSATHFPYQTCVVGTAGEVRCLRPPEHQLRDEASRDLYVFRAPGGRRLHDVVAGARHVCALDDERRAFCWGDNAWGQLGSGGKETSTTPTLVASGEAFAKLSSGRSHTCGLTTKHQLLCWGLGLGDVLGVSPTDTCQISVERVPHRPKPEPAPCSLTPRMVQLPDGATDVAAGDQHTCALTRGQGLFCWGYVYNIGFSGRVPTKIEDRGVRLVSITSGSRHVCGLDGTGHAYCWGRNWAGQLGVPVSESGSSALAPVAGSGAYQAIVGGDEHTCAITIDGRASCWGHNHRGQLGDGTRNDSDRPTLVASDLRWRALAAGHSHTCGITERDVLYCWGSGLAFRLAPGSLHEQPEPFPVAGWQ